LGAGPKLIDHLAAGAAGRGGARGIGGDGDGTELARLDPFADRLPDGDAFGADGEPVARVFDVAAGVDGAVQGFDGRADEKARIGSKGLLPRCDR